MKEATLWSKVMYVKIAQSVDCVPAQSHRIALNLIGCFYKLFSTSKVYAKKKKKLWSWAGLIFIEMVIQNRSSTGSDKKMMQFMYLYLLCTFHMAWFFFQEDTQTFFIRYSIYMLRDLDIFISSLPRVLCTKPFFF